MSASAADIDEADRSSSSRVMVRPRVPISKATPWAAGVTSAWSSVPEPEMIRSVAVVKSPPIEAAVTSTS